MPTVEPYEVLMRRNGQTWALSARSLITLDDGTVVEGKPVPLNGLADPAFAQVATLVSASKESEIATLTTERDGLQNELSDLQADYDAKVNDNESKHFQIQTLTEQVATLTAERDARPTQAQLNAANARIAELEALLNPPNPFPNADWQGFRSAALSSPVIMRMAMSNVGNFMMLLIYMTELQKDPSVAAKMAAVWNEMETKTPLSTQEIAAVNSLAQAHSVPFALNSEGQIVLP